MSTTQALTETPKKAVSSSNFHQLPSTIDIIKSLTAGGVAGGL